MHPMHPANPDSDSALATIPVVVGGRISRLLIDGEGVRVEEWDAVGRRWRSLGGGLFEIAVVSDGRPATTPELREAGIPSHLWPRPMSATLDEQTAEAC